MPSETVKVIVRCRPLNKREKDLNSKVVVSMDSSSGQCNIVNPEDPGAPPKNFTFDGAYHIDSTTEQIYNEIAYPLVESVTEGYNGTVFAYGQTGCGKSFTMQGVQIPANQRGIIPRAFEHIFEAIATAENTKFLVHASYLEIYNEEIRDLLGEDSKKKLDLKEHPDKGVYVPGLSLHAVHNVKECENVMEQGWKNRSVGATLMNADSSRSHSIFSIYMETLDMEENSSKEHIRTGKLNLVDLAGSERQAKTGATGDRLKEATKINLSLSALGNVISALVDGKAKHIPYRDSKLTRLLQDSLGGNTKTLMVACLSPADNNYDETLSTLRYANRAKNIQNKPKINEDPKDALLREYQEEIKRLKALITSEPQEIIEQQKPQVNGEVIDSVAQKIREEYDTKMQELLTKYQKEQESNAKLQSDVNKMKEKYESELAKLNKAKADGLQQNGHDPDAGSPIPTIQAEEPVPPSLEEMQAHALERLQELEEQIVGGEKANDKSLKEKRAKRKTIAEKRVRAISEALMKVDEDDRVMLKVYDDIQEELKAKTTLVKKAKRKIQALENEISDLHREFEMDRTDYLETIRKQDQQLKLAEQILEKIQPCLRRDCNYSSVEKIKSEAVWDEDIQRWKLPELVIMRTKLPPPGIQPGGRPMPTQAHSANSRQSFYGDSEPLNGESHETSNEDKFFQKLEKSVKEDVAGNYFRPKRQEQLLSKFQGAAKLVLSSRKGPNGVKKNGFNLLQVNSSNGNLTNNQLLGSISPESRKPTRLQALPAGGLNNTVSSMNNINTSLHHSNIIDLNKIRQNKMVAAARDNFEWPT